MKRAIDSGYLALGQSLWVLPGLFFLLLRLPDNDNLRQDGSSEGLAKGRVGKVVPGRGDSRGLIEEPGRRGWLGAGWYWRSCVWERMRMSEGALGVRSRF